MKMPLLQSKSSITCSNKAVLFYDALKTFFKYHSIGNDFVIFDLRCLSTKQVAAITNDRSWPLFVRAVCHRNIGVGADCVLLIEHGKSDNHVTLHVFNADGTSAQNCLNGVRCVAFHVLQKLSNETSVIVRVGGINVVCSVNKCTSEVVTRMSDVIVKDKVSITVLGKDYGGLVVNAGNPHYVVFEKSDREHLQRYGPLISQHEVFTQGTNVEFVWPESDLCYQSVVYERGVGITLGCGSGAAAIIAAIKSKKKLLERAFCSLERQKKSIGMPGGVIVGWYDGHDNIFLQAGVQFVFSGTMMAQWFLEQYQ